MKFRVSKLVLLLALFLTVALCAVGAQAYGDVRRVGFTLRGIHGPYTAELYPAGSAQPIRRASDIYPPGYGTRDVVFDYTSTGIQYRVRVVNDYGDIWSGWFYLSPNKPGLWDSIQNIGPITGL